MRDLDLERITSSAVDPAARRTQVEPHCSFGHVLNLLSLARLPLGTILQFAKAVNHSVEPHDEPSQGFAVSWPRP